MWPHGNQFTGSCIIEVISISYSILFPRTSDCNVVLKPGRSSETEGALSNRGGHKQSFLLFFLRLNFFRLFVCFARFIFFFLSSVCFYIWFCFESIFVLHCCLSIVSTPHLLASGRATLIFTYCRAAVESYRKWRWVFTHIILLLMRLTVNKICLNRTQNGPFWGEERAVLKVMNWLDVNTKVWVTVISDTDFYILYSNWDPDVFRVDLLSPSGCMHMELGASLTQFPGRLKCKWACVWSKGCCSKGGVQAARLASEVVNLKKGRKEGLFLCFPHL